MGLLKAWRHLQMGLLKAWRQQMDLLKLRVIQKVNMLLGVKSLLLWLLLMAKSSRLYNC